MMIKPLFLLSILILVAVLPLTAQTISHPIKSHVKNGGSETEFWITLSDHKNKEITVVISDLGEIKYFLGETPTFTYDNHPDNTYRIRKCDNTEFDYYPKDQGVDISNKPSKIGEYKIDYHRNWIQEYTYGKISQLGNLTFEYYTGFTNDGKSGKLSHIGSLKIDYFTDSPAFRGKVISIGNYKINYCTTSQGVNNFGKICSVSGTDNNVDVLVEF